MIRNLSIGDLTIDCTDAERACGFYANLMGWEKTTAFGCAALKTDIGMTILFAVTDISYVPPVWPEEPGEQQKQMHLDFTVDDFTATVDKALQLGATKARTQYGGNGFITMLDTEGHPFCLCGRPESKSEKSAFDLYFEEKGYGVIPDISINVDCKKQKILREFYAQLTGWDQGFHKSALVADNGMIVCFQGCDNDATMDEYLPPVWPEQTGKQQKQMHFNFRVDDLQSAVEAAVSFGATKPIRQFGGQQGVTLLDVDGHPFSLCQK